MSADASLDEEVGLHGDDARKPGLFPYEAATKKMARIKKQKAFEISHPRAWVHVGDDVVNDCAFAKTFGARAVRVSVPGVEPYVPGGEQPAAVPQEEAAEQGNPQEELIATPGPPSPRVSTESQHLT